MRRHLMVKILNGIKVSKPKCDQKHISLNSFQYIQHPSCAGSFFLKKGIILIGNTSFLCTTMNSSVTSPAVTPTWCMDPLPIGWIDNHAQQTSIFSMPPNHTTNDNKEEQINRNVNVDISGTSFVLSSDTFSQLALLPWDRTDSSIYYLNASPFVFEKIIDYVLYQALPKKKYLSQNELEELMSLSNGMHLQELLDHLNKIQGRKNHKGKGVPLFRKKTPKAAGTVATMKENKDSTLNRKNQEKMGIKFGRRGRNVAPTK